MATEVPPAAEPRRFDAAYYALAALVAGIDQATKAAATHWLAPAQPAPFLGPVASLTLTHNDRSAMGLVPVRGFALAAVTAVVVGLLLLWGPRAARGSRLAWWGLVLLLGGAVGNLIDRLRLGYVVDFIDFHFWPVFNVADIAVVCGAALAVIALYWRHDAPVASKAR